MDAEALYQEQILAYARSAREGRRLDAPSCSAEATNPTCGDRVKIDLEIDANGRIAAVGAKIDGCALCEAAAGLAMENLPGLDGTEAATIGDALDQWLKGSEDAPGISGHETFTPVRSFNGRHRCVCLPFVAAAKAITSADLKD